MRKGMVIGYAARFPNDLVSFQGEGAQESCGTLNLLPTEQKKDFDVIQEE